MIDHALAVAATCHAATQPLRVTEPIARPHDHTAATREIPGQVSDVVWTVGHAAGTGQHVDRATHATVIDRVPIRSDGPLRQLAELIFASHAEENFGPTLSIFQVHWCSLAVPVLHAKIRATEESGGIRATGQHIRWRHAADALHALPVLLAELSSMQASSLSPPGTNGKPRQRMSTPAVSRTNSSTV